jgi:hypothetical protein
MAKIGEVYGQNFDSQSRQSKATYAANLYARNIVHREFNFRNSSKEMWNGNNMKPEIIQFLVDQVKRNNNMFRLVHIAKSGSKARLQIFPYLINGAVEYFTVVDLSNKDKTQIYSIYITPEMMEAY